MVDSKNNYYLRKKQRGSKSVIESIWSIYDFASSSVFMIFQLPSGNQELYYYSGRPDFLSKDLFNNRVRSLCIKTKWEF